MSKDTKQPSSMLSDVGVTAGVRTLWEENLLFDFVITLADRQFRVHRVIIAAVSGFFKAMLTEEESWTVDVTLEGLDPLAVSNMIEYIYTGQFGAPTASAEELLVCAVYFQIPTAIKDCIKLLRKGITKHNCLDVLSVFEGYCLDDGIEQTIKYIKKNFDAIVRVCISDKIPHEALLRLIDFWMKSEWDLFDVINQWFHVDVENSPQQLNYLMSHVRFVPMTPEQLETVKNLDVYSDLDDAVCDLINKAEEYHHLHTHLKVLDDSMQTQVRAEPTPVYYADGMICYHHIGKHSEFVDVSWEPNLDSEADGITSLTVNNFLVVYGQPRESSRLQFYGKPRESSTRQGLYILDPRNLKWASMTSMVAPRYNFSLVHHDKYLYALGGSREQVPKPNIRLVTDSIERYDFETNTWSIIPSCLPVPLAYHGAGVISGSIYIAGGWNTNPSEFSTRLDCFNVCTKRWQSKASMNKPHDPFNKVQVMQLGDEEVLFLLDRFLVMQYYTPSTDQWCYLNCPVLAKSEFNSSEFKRVTVHPLQNTLYLLNIDYEIQKKYYTNSHNGTFEEMCEEMRSEWDESCDSHDSCYSEHMYEGAKWTFEEGGQRVSEVLLGDCRGGLSAVMSIPMHHFAFNLDMSYESISDICGDNHKSDESVSSSSVDEDLPVKPKRGPCSAKKLSHEEVVERVLEYCRNEANHGPWY